MRRKMKRVAILIAVIAIPVIILVAFAFYPKTLSEVIAARISKETGRAVTIDGGLDLAVGLQPVLTARDVRVANPEWAARPNMLEIEHLQVRFDLSSLVRGRWTVSNLLLRGASLHLERSHEGHSNWDLGGAADQPHAPPWILRLVIEDSRVTLQDRSRDVALHASVTSAGEGDPDGPGRVLIVDGTGQFKGDALELAIRGGSLLALQAQDEAYPFEVGVRIGGTRAKLVGTVNNPLHPMALNMKLEIAGPNAALLAPVLQLPMPVTRPYELSGELVREADIWRFENFSGVVGDSDLAGSMSLDVSQQRPMLVADLVSKQIELEDLGPVFGLRADALAGGERGRTSPGRILSDTPLQRDQMRNTDARVKFSAKDVVTARLPLLQDVELDLGLTGGVLTLTPLRFGFRGGAAKLFTSIDANAEPAHTELDLRLSGIDLQNVLDAGGVDGSAEGSLQGRVTLSADGDTLRSKMAAARGQASLVMGQARIDGSTLALIDAGFLEALAVRLGRGEPDPMLINCLAAGFVIRDGVMTTTGAVLDTEQTLIRGDGTIDLGEERLNLGLRGRAKRAGIGHTRMAVVISGPFVAPSAQVDTSEVLLRGGFALGLGALLAPAAAILPFVDLGLAGDSDCVKLVDDAERDQD